MCLIWLMWKTGVKNALVFFQTKAAAFCNKCWPNINWFRKFDGQSTITDGWHILVNLKCLWNLIKITIASIWKKQLIHKNAAFQGIGIILLCLYKLKQRWHKVSTTLLQRHFLTLPQRCQLTSDKLPFSANLQRQYNQRPT